MKNIILILLLSMSLIFAGCGDIPEEQIDEQDESQEEVTEEVEEEEEQEGEEEKQNEKERSTDKEKENDEEKDSDLEDEEIEYDNDREQVMATDLSDDAERFNYDVDGEFLGYDAGDFWNNPDDLISEHGEPEVEEDADEVVGMTVKSYYFGDFEMNYMYFAGVPEEGEEEFNFLNAVITEEGYQVTERGIEVGDHFIDVLEKYPDEQPEDPKIMYQESDVGTRIEINYDENDNVQLIKLVDAPEESTPFGIDLQVEDGHITEIEYYFAI